LEHVCILNRAGLTQAVQYWLRAI